MLDPGGPWDPLSVGEVGTLFGSPHPVFTTHPVPEGTPLTVLVRDSPGCFVGYALLGGP